MSTCIEKVALLGVRIPQEHKNIYFLSPLTAVRQATGNLGPFIFAALTSHNFSVTIISRLSSTATFPPNSNIIRINDSFDENELAAAFKGQDAVVNCISHAGHHTQKSIINAAVHAGVRRYIPSGFASNSENTDVLELQPRLAKNAEIVSYCARKRQRA
jgi:putative NADH-flavin reductase